MRSEKSEAKPGSYLAAQVWLKPSSVEAERCRDLRAECSPVWNAALAERRACHEETGKYPSALTLYRRLKTGKPSRLHSQTVLDVFYALDEHVSGTFSKKREGDERAQFPWKEKRYRMIIWAQDAVTWQGERLRLAKRQKNQSVLFRVPRFSPDGLAAAALSAARLLAGGVARSPRRRWRESGCAQPPHDHGR
ncbi:MAG: hypothetical protein M0Z66_14690 [Thermaerobacter sp.]|nr:hypothetical protein [Thermaerobacter sp.]